jgi:hypothetical protein
MNTGDIDDLRRALDDSPRKMIRTGADKSCKTASRQQSNNTLRGDRRVQPYDVQRCHRRHASSTSSLPRLPRLQISTSGLGFSDTDFDISPMRPAKLVNDKGVTTGFHRSKRSGFTEKERRDMKIQQELSSARRRSREGQAPWGWKNVAVEGNGRATAHTIKGKAKAVWVDQ